MDKTIFVFENFFHDDPKFLGTLFTEEIRGFEIYSFQYDEKWMENLSAPISLDPAIQFYADRQYSSDKKIFGVFSDASPDRWGRALLKKKEAIRASKENVKPRKLMDSDYLLGVYDESRMGGLRFKLEMKGDFLSAEEDSCVPPWTSLRTLEEAARKLEDDKESENEAWLNKLIIPGSSLGGARPKASVVNAKGGLWIAKFPSAHDEYNIGAWEKVASDLALMCGLNVPESQYESFSKLGGTFLVKRFDRDHGRRIHYASAMTLLGKNDGDSAMDGVSYLDIANFIKSYGNMPNKDLEELWLRIVFNMAISNTDDHLRNHGFILSNNGWHLSPVFDVNPVPYGDGLSLNIDSVSNTISFDLAIDAAKYFNISHKDACEKVNNVRNVVKSNWENLAREYEISKAEIDNMKPAFSECYRN